MQLSVLMGATAVALVALLPVLSLVAAAAAAAHPGARTWGGDDDLDSSWRWTAAGACPHYCHCYVAGAGGAGGAGLRSADCSGRQLASAEDLKLPRDTDAADLSDNAIWALQDGSFRAQGLTRLLELRLAKNGIREVGAWAFAGLRRLHLLDLSHNHLQTLHPGTFDDNRGLKVLLLAGNNLARLPADRPLLAAPRLQVLDLSGCRLAHLGSTVLSELPTLASLNLSANYLIQVQPQALDQQGKLQVLDLTRNPLACDLNTRQLLQLLSVRNVTISTSCPPAEARAPVAQLSKHLARLQSDVLPRPRQGQRQGDKGEDEKEAVRRDNGDDGEAILDLDHLDSDHEQPTRFGSARTHEGLVDISDLSNFNRWVPETGELEDYIEDDHADDNPPTAEPSGTGQRVNTTGCSPLFPDRISKNPILIRDWFDQIPSFWAAIFGCQVGLVLGLVLSTCACRFTFWRAFCCPCGPCGSGSSPCSRRERSLSHIRHRVAGRGRGRSRLSLDMAYTDLSSESWGWDGQDVLAAALCGPCDGGGLTVPRTRGRTMTVNPSLPQEGALWEGRPETPPPAYADLCSV